MNFSVTDFIPFSISDSLYLLTLFAISYERTYVSGRGISDVGDKKHGRGSLFTTEHDTYLITMITNSSEKETGFTGCAAFGKGGK